ncbi:DoxX family protein [Streptomyces sp. NPDC005962]|uniref:DoxX family protein n=1 Tax=Streptomyces sp. NPDC005962 TaxID=3154466 RepID=UPI0033EF2F88
MNITLRIMAGVLAAAFLAAGAMKLSQFKEKLVGSGMTWVEHVPRGAVRAIGTVEVLGALGLILPAALGFAPALVAWATAGLALTMLGAALLHARRKEMQAIPVNLVLLGPAAVGRRRGLAPLRLLRVLTGGPPPPSPAAPCLRP